MKKYRLLSLFAVLSLTATVSLGSQSTPAVRGEDAPPSQSTPVHPYQNPALTPEQRAADLCSRLTLEEKCQLMRNGSPAIPRLGIPAFDWWSEALHGVGRNGLCTVFPSCIGMAASFDDDLIEQVFTAVSDEARAKNTAARAAGRQGKYSGLSFWTPNINVFRDPRWGRGQETYGEDPYMNGRMGLRVVRGLQGPGSPDSSYYKLLACAKHYAVHSGPEKTRHSFDISNLPQRELWETYLPAFKVLVQDGGVREVMCAYQRFEGDPCCGSDRLLQSILRNEWGFDGVVVSDCGAIDDFYKPGRHEVSADAAAASAKGVRAGTDVECGSVYRTLPEAVQRGEISEAEIDTSVRRLLAERFRVGDLDPDSLVAWTQIQMSVVASPEHKALARQMAREQMVLLKNNGILPLSKDASRIVVLGPNAADSVMPWGIYYGQPSHTVTVLEGIEAKVGRVPYAKACGITNMASEQSIMDRIVAPDGAPGLAATYWNNVTRTGAPVATARYSAPVSLDNGGNTAFETGVNLTDFALTMSGRYVADADETLNMVLGNDDELRVIVNGDTIHNRYEKHGVARNTRKLQVERGRTYDITVEYTQHADVASFSFDILRSVEITPDQVVALVDTLLADEALTGRERRPRPGSPDGDIVIFVGGISPLLEREEKKVQEPGFDNGDRTSIELPQAQRDIIAALHRAGKRVVFVNCSGSAVALTPEAAICDAILQAWYPGEQGGHAVADVLFGDYNPSGRLPVTFYKGDAQLPPFDEYRMAGRTYRYLKEAPLYPFGFGLSYTTFAFGTPSYDGEEVTVDVTNTGDVAGTQVVQLYMRCLADFDGPNMTLRGYERVDLTPGETRAVKIAMPRDLFENWDPDLSQMRVVPGDYELLIGASSNPLYLRRIPVTLE